MNFDEPTQRFLITAVKNQISMWRAKADHADTDEDDKVDMQNDIGFAFTVLSEMEEQFFQAFGYHPD